MFVHTDGPGEKYVESIRSTLFNTGDVFEACNCNSYLSTKLLRIEWRVLQQQEESGMQTRLFLVHICTKQSLCFSPLLNSANKCSRELLQ